MLLPAIAATGTLLTGRKCDASGYNEDAVAAIVNNFLQSPARQPWAELLALAGEMSPMARSHLARDSTAGKVAASLAAHGPEAAARLARWTLLLAHLFPQIREALARRSSHCA